MAALPNSVNSSAQTIEHKEVTQDLTSGTETVISMQTPIATFTRVANEITSTPSLLGELVRPHLGVYPRPEITQMLSRAYKLAPTIWQPGFTGSRYEFPKDLFAASNLMTQLMTNFVFFRAKAVEITLKLASTPYYQGALLAGWIPDITTSTPSPTVHQLSFCPNVVISASKQDSAIITIPWLAAVDYLRLTEAAPCELGGLFINTLVDLVPPVGATSSLQITVFAKFIDPEVTGYTKQSSNKHRFDSEAAKKDEQGIDAQSIVSSVSKIARKIPIVGDIWNPIADTLNSLSGDLSKPTSNQAYTKTIMNSQENYSFASGEFFGNPISLYPNAKMEQATTMYGMETSHMTVSQLAQRPSLYAGHAFNSVTPTWSVVVDPSIRDPTIPGPNYFNFVMKAHARWRGSMKYLLYFCCNAFHACKVRISLAYGTRAGIARDEDIPYQIVDIKGDTWHQLTVPYLRQFAWTHQAETILAPTLTVSLESPITGESLPATPTIFMIVFRAAGEDVQFSRLSNAHAAVPSSEVRKASLKVPIKQTSFQDRFKKTFEPIVQGCQFATEHGFVNSETTLTVSDCLKRFGNAITRTHNGVEYHTLPEQTGGPLGSLLEPYHYFGTLFKYFRGSRRIVRLSKTSGFWDVAIIRPYNSYIGDADFLVAGWGVVPFQTALTRDAFEIPWYSSIPYTANDRISVAYPGYPDDVILPSSAPSIDSSYLVCGGDDFVGLHLLWPIDYAA